MKRATKLRKDLQYYVDGVLRGDRIALAQSITLIESTLPSDQQLAFRLMEKIISGTGKSVRIGITGTPGVGKSTFIESFGQFVTRQGKKLAVLTIDPSSQLTKGSILGDKTRMEELSRNRNAFIRPSSSSDALGGVAHKTRETILLCEAAGFDTILIETVGVGQSEVAVKNMTDFFLLLMLAGSGDELQGIKKGIMEMADAVVITKADGDNVHRAHQAKAEFQHALHLLYNHQSSWIHRVLTCSAVDNSGIEEIWNVIQEYIRHTTSSGVFSHNRKQQNITHLNEHFQFLLKCELEQAEDLKQTRKTLEEKVADSSLSPNNAGKMLFDAYREYLQTKRS